MDRKSVLISLSLIAFVAVCRLVPHLANFSPMVCLSLFLGRHLNKRLATVTIVLSMLLTDILLGVIYGYPLFGNWMWFTYSALLAILVLGVVIAKRSSAVTVSVVTLLASTLGFWIWTNFGVWLFSPSYSSNLSGLVTCYVVAIPFLQTSLIGMCIWGGIYFVTRAVLRSSIFQIRSQSYLA